MVNGERGENCVFNSTCSSTQVAEQKEDPQKVADLQKVETLKVRVWVGLLQLKGGGREGNADNDTC